MSEDVLDIEKHVKGNGVNLYFLVFDIVGIDISVK